MKKTWSIKVKEIVKKPEALYLVVTGLFFVASFIHLFVTRGSSLDKLVFLQGRDRFMDFFNHIDYVKNHPNVYFESPHACFPPLIYFMYYLLGHILPEGEILRFSAVQTGNYALLLYVAYTAVLAVLFVVSVCFLVRKQKSGIMIALTVMVSNVFLFSVLERGNSVLIVVVLLLIALAIRDSEKKWQRELALILIAVAAAIKLYPAVFGLLYLREKRWKEAIRLTVYGIVLFALPFAFFGGFSGFLQFLANQSTIQTGSGAGFGSIRSMLLLLGEKTGLSLDVFSLLLTAVVFAVLIASTVLAKEKWVQCFFLAAMMSILPFWSGSYTGILYVIPLTLFMKEAENTRFVPVWSALFGVLFSLFTIVPEAFFAALNETPSTVLRQLTVLIILILLLIRVIRSFLSDRKKVI